MRPAWSSQYKKENACSSCSYGADPERIQLLVEYSLLIM